MWIFEPCFGLPVLTCFSFELARCIILRPHTDTPVHPEVTFCCIGLPDQWSVGAGFLPDLVCDTGYGGLD